MKQQMLNLALEAYRFPSPLLDVSPYGMGHINETYCVLCKPGKGSGARYILQRINTNVFPHPEALMENMLGVTRFLREKITASGGDPSRETLTVLPTRDGEYWYTDPLGGVWRLTSFIEGTECLQSASTPALFAASGRAFGKFQQMLQEYPAETLHETIAKFHDTRDRFRKFQLALEADILGRAALVQPEIAFVLAREADCAVALEAMERGELPLRVTHNDTKLNNILLDCETGEGICVIDLDTVMPGLSIHDFGDAIRFGANHCQEDEKDLSKVNFDIELYEVFAKGFLEGAGGTLTPGELAHLPWGARLMTLECGIRFLTDYLEGDRYFHTRYEGQNLDRSRTQFKLVQDMEAKFDTMEAIIRRYSDE